ncbi:MAG: hypothetical protein ABH814_03905 [bacterium]
MAGLGRRALQALYAWEVRHVDIAWLWGCMGDPIVYLHSATAGALFRIDSYEGFWGDIRLGRFNPLGLLAAKLHNGFSYNARAVRNRSDWTARQIVADRPKVILDVAAGAGGGSWKAVRELGWKDAPSIVAVDYDPFSIEAARRAAAYYGFSGAVHPAWVYRHIGEKAIGRLGGSVAPRLGLTPEEVWHQALLGDDARLGDILKNLPRGYSPVLANAFRLCGDGWWVTYVMSMGFLDYLSFEEIVKALQMMRGFMRAGGILLTAHMLSYEGVSNPPPAAREEAWVDALPWRDSKFPLKRKQRGVFLDCVRQAGFIVESEEIEKNGVYVLVRARAV